jgi:hypothetical protein
MFEKHSLHMHKHIHKYGVPSRTHKGKQIGAVKKKKKKIIKKTHTTYFCLANISSSTVPIT